MHYLSKILPVSALALTLLLSACVIDLSGPSKPDSPQSTMAIMVLKNPDAKAKPAIYYRVTPVTFDNRTDEGRYPKKPAPNLQGQCFGAADRVCVSFNLLPGRYHVDSFYTHKGQNGTIFSLTGEMQASREPSAGDYAKAIGAAFGVGKTPDIQMIYDPNDLYFVLPRSEPHFVGSFLWSENAQGFLASLIKSGSFGMAPDKNGISERTALLTLLQDKEFQKEYVQWLPMVRQRLAKLPQAAVAAPAAAPLQTPATVKPPPAPKPKDDRKKQSR